MTVNLSQIPEVFDLLHGILAALALTGFLIAFNKKPQLIEKEVEVEKIVEVEKPVEKIVEVEVEKVVEIEKVIEKVVEVESNLTTTNQDSALQLLSLMQKEARLIDFLNEDLTGFSDEDVGAAARVIHSGGQKLLKNYVELSAVRNEQEETSIEIAADFDPQQIRLVGNVVGNGPYRGLLLHKGWQVDSLSLPKLSKDINLSIIAPAEVEL